MNEQNKDVKQNETQAQSNAQEQTPNVSEDVNSQGDKVDKSVYEKVREAMKAERQQRKEKDAKIAELEAKINKLGQTPPQEGDYDPYKAKTDLLFEMNKDPFLKENLDLVEDKMSDNPNLDVRQAITAVKAEFFDRIEKESVVESTKPPKQEKPTAVQETKKQIVDSPKSFFQRAIKGEIDIDPAQLEAIRRHLPSE
jgi:hypothetical protein